jgi:hypothetical protein
MNLRDFFDSQGHPRNAEQPQSFPGVNEQIKIAALCVIATQSGAKYTGIQPVVKCDDPADFIAMASKSDRWLHRPQSSPRVSCTSGMVEQLADRDQGRGLLS